MITLERLDEGSALSRRGDPGPATSPTEEAAIAQRIRTAGASRLLVEAALAAAAS